MGDKPASLLTKRQRDHVAAGFESVEGAKRRRERQRVRQRITAGVDDFRHLVDYSDDELQAAFEDVDDEDLTAALADARLFTERVRLLHDIDEDRVTERARAHREQIADRPQSLSRVEASSETPEADDESTVWTHRSEIALKLGTVVVLPGVSLIPVPFGVVPPAVDGALAFVALAFGGPLLAFGLLVLLADAVKHDVVPAVRTFTSDPRGTLERLWNAL